MAVFEVEDNGEGLDDELTSFLFKSRLLSKKENLPYASGKKGCALRIIYLKAEEMGGSVGFENKGRYNGAKFWISLPIPYDNATE